MKQNRKHSVRALDHVLIRALVVALILLALIAGDAVLAAESSSALSLGTSAPVGTSVSAVASPAPVTKISKKFGADLTNTYSTSVVEASANQRSASNDVELAPWVQLTKNLKADLYLAISKDLRNNRETKFQNMTLGLSHTPISVIGNTLKYRLKGTVILPTAEDDRNLASFNGGITLGNRFLLSLKAIPAFSSYYQLSVGKSFHQFQTTASGESNNQFSVGHTLLLNYDISQFYLQAVPRITSRWTYDGNPSTRFELAEEVGVNLGRFTLGVGHSNSDNLVKANGRDSNFSVFDSDTSNYYLTANLSF